MKSPTTMSGVEGMAADVVLGAACAVLVHRVTTRNPVMIAHSGRTSAVRFGPTTTFGEVLAALRHSGHAVGAPDVSVRDGQVVSDTTAAVTAERLETVLPQLTGDLGLPVFTAEVVGSAEREVLLGFNPPPRPFPPRLVHEVIADQAARTPERIAVRQSGDELTYRRLVERASLVARRLRAEGIGTDAVVALCTERSVEMVVAVLGILFAGAAYLPLEPTHPPARLAVMAGSADARAILVSDGCLPAVEGWGPLPLTMDGKRRGGDVPRPLAEAPLGEPLSQEDWGRAYVIFTSGSTGTPKGVEMTHRSLANRLGWMQDSYRLTGEDVVMHKTPYTFDVSVWELLWPLMYGARLVLAEPQAHRDPEALAELIQRERVTTAHFVPSMLSLFVAEPGMPGCTSLRTVICSGEVLPPKTVNKLTASLGASVYNLYGPTEAAIDVTAWPCRRPEPGSGVPIGSPIANVAVYLLDEQRRLAPLGGVGELYLGGECLARGYAGSPELTAERFVEITVGGATRRVYRTGDLGSWTPDGSVRYLGRADGQVKIHGQRVELGEIETVLSGHPLVVAAVVVYRDASSLVGYVVAEPGQDPSEAELRSYLLSLLPGYMVPARYVVIPRVPTTANGKVDREALPLPGRRERVSPGTAHRSR